MTAHLPVSRQKNSSCTISGVDFFMFLCQATDLKSYFYFIHPSFSNSKSSVGNIIVHIMMPQVRLRLYDENICHIQIYIMYNIGNLSGFIWCSYLSTLHNNPTRNISQCEHQIRKIASRPREPECTKFIFL